MKKKTTGEAVEYKMRKVQRYLRHIESATIFLCRLVFFVFFSSCPFFFLLWHQSSVSRGKLELVALRVEYIVINY